MLKEYLGKTTVASLIKLIKTELTKYVKTTSMDDRIPQPTFDDNGKFVRVINGKYMPAKHDCVSVSSAKIGQVAVVKSVDENGKPIEWTAVDLPSEDIILADRATGTNYVLYVKDSKLTIEAI